MVYKQKQDLICFGKGCILKRDKDNIYKLICTYYPEGVYTRGLNESIEFNYNNESRQTFEIDIRDILDMEDNNLSHPILKTTKTNPLMIPSIRTPEMLLRLKEKKRSDILEMNKEEITKRLKKDCNKSDEFRKVIEEMELSLISR